MSSVSPGSPSPSSMDQSRITSYTQQHPANVQALKVFRTILQSCLGPSGHLKMIQNECGGHVTVTSSSKRLLKSLSLSKPILKLISAAIDGHLKVYSDGGLYAGLLACCLIEGCWETGLHPAMCIAVNELLLDICLKIMSATCQVPVNLGSMESLLSLVKPVIHSKPGCGMTEKDVSVISSLVVQSFISSLPSNGQDGQLTIPEVQMIGVESQEVDESHIIQGVLVEAPDLPASFTKEISTLRLETGVRQGCVRVAVYNISLAGDTEELTDARFEFSPGVQVQDATLAAMGRLMEHLVELRVGLVACQKVIHPSIKQLLRRKGVLALDRISAIHIGAVQQIAGAAVLSSLDPSIPESSLGHLTDIRHHVMFDKSYLHLSNQTSSLCTLVLCNITEQGLEELKHTCQVAHHTLGLALRDPTAVPGAGCLEFILAYHLRQQVRDDFDGMLQDLGCTKTQLLHLTEKFASCLESVGMATYHDGEYHVTESASHHQWPLPKGSMADYDWLDRLGRCGCGMKSANELRESEWTVAGNLKCRVHTIGKSSKAPPDTEVSCDQSHDQQRTFNRASTTWSGEDATPPVHDGIDAASKFDSHLTMENEKQETILDLFAVKCNAFRTAIEIANMVLRIGHTVENIN